MSLFSLSLLLFLIMDPFGNIETYLRLYQTLPSTSRRFFLLREMGFALFLMLLFVCIGEGLFSLLHLSEAAVSLTTGLVLFLFAIQVLFYRHQTLRARPLPQEPFLIPLAVPLIAGPALLMTLLLFTHLETSSLTLLAAIAIAWICSYFVFLLAPFFHKIFKVNGLLALEKLMAMVLILLAIQRFLDGIKQAVLL